MFDYQRGQLPTNRPTPMTAIEIVNVSPLFVSITERPGYEGPAGPAALANVVRLVPGLTRLPVGPESATPFDQAA